MKVPLKEILGIRIVSSGTATILPTATVVLDTKVLNPNEVAFPAAFLTNNVANAVWDWGSFSPTFTDSVKVYFRRTTNANEIQLVCTNNNLISSRTIQWAIITIQL